MYKFFSPSSVGGGRKELAGSCPVKAFSTGLGESVRSLETGKVSSDQHPEVVACTFRGRVCSLTTQALEEVTDQGVRRLRAP